MGSFVVMTMFYILFRLLTDSTYWLGFIVILLFSLSAISYPLAVGLTTREVNPEEQGRLQGAVSVLETTGKIVAPLLASHVLIPNFDQPHQFNGMVYLVAGLIVAPGVLLAGML